MRQHVMFAAIALLFGVAYAFVTPPFEVPDEVGHYWRASSIAYGFSGAGTPIMPRGFRILVWALWMPKRDVHLTAEKIRLARGVQLESEIRVPLRVPAYYSPAAYMPQIGAALGTRAAAARPFFGFYAGRLATLLVSIVLVTFASAIAPDFREHFHAVALLPMSLFLFASWSADAMSIVAAFLTSALLLRAIVAVAPITFRELVFIACASLWLSLCKPSYALIVLLAVLIPLRRFESRGRYLAFASVLPVLVICTSFLSVSLTMSTAIALPRRDIPVDAHAQLQFIKDDPKRFAAVLFADLEKNGVGYLESMVGRFGMYDVPPPIIAIAVFWGLLAALGLMNGPALSLRVRIFTLLIVAAIITGILTYLYLTSSIAGGTTIEGPQGRYLLPLLPLLLTLMRLPPIPVRVPHSLIIVVAVASNAIGIAVLLHRYW